MVSRTYGRLRLKITHAISRSRGPKRRPDRRHRRGAPKTGTSNASPSFPRGGPARGPRSRASRPPAFDSIWLRIALHSAGHGAGVKRAAIEVEHPQFNATGGGNGESDAIEDARDDGRAFHCANRASSCDSNACGSRAWENRARDEVAAEISLLKSWLSRTRLVRRPSLMRSRAVSLTSEIQRYWRVPSVMHTATSAPTNSQEKRAVRRSALRLTQVHYIDYGSRDAGVTAMLR